MVLVACLDMLSRHEIIELTFYTLIRDLEGLRHFLLHGNESILLALDCPDTLL